MIGTDLVEINRIRIALERTPHFKTRVFTAGEIAYCESKADPYQSFAARFAAKEAFRKLHPELASGTRFHEVEVVLESGGRPGLCLSGQALEKAQSLSFDLIDISLTHAGEYAMAVAIAISKGKGDEK